MLEKSRNAVFFHMIRVSGQSKSRPVKAAGAEVGAERRHQKLHAAVAKSRFWSENAKKLTVSEHFLKFRCRIIVRRCGEKQILKWKCYKTHDGLGALFEVQMSKNCTPLWRKAHFEVKMWQNTSGLRSTFCSFTMSNNCTPLWRKAHLEVKMLKNCSLRSTFGRSDVEKSYAAVAKSTFGSENVQKL